MQQMINIPTWLQLASSMNIMNSRHLKWTPCSYGWHIWCDIYMTWSPHWSAFRMMPSFSSSFSSLSLFFSISHWFHAFIHFEMLFKIHRPNRGWAEICFRSSLTSKNWGMFWPKLNTHCLLPIAHWKHFLLALCVHFFVAPLYFLSH